MRALQKDAETIGKYGCYFLSLIAGLKGFSESNLDRKVSVDIFELFEYCQKKGWLDEECTVINPDAIGKFVLGFNCVTRKANIEYKPLTNEIEITKYTRGESGKTWNHFVLTRDNKVLYDPYGNSQTVAKGKPLDKRII